MNDTDADLIAQLMALKDDVREPMTNHMRVSFVPGREPSLEDLKRATADLFTRHPRLQLAFVLDAQGMRWQGEPGLGVEGLVERAWEHNALPLHDFQQLPIATQTPPLLRLRYSQEDGLSAAVHHCVVDGRAQLLLSLEFLASAFGQALPAPEIIPIGSIGRRRPSMLGLLVELLRRAWRSLFNPPVFLGGLKRFGTRQVHLEAVIPRERSEALFAKARARIGHVTWNDVLLTAFHLALGDLADERRGKGLVAGGNDRISIMTPMDLRRWVLPKEPLINWSSYISSASFAAERKGSPWDLLKKTSVRMGTAKLLGLDYGMVWVGRFAAWLGLYRKGQAHRLKHGVSMRARQPDSQGWRGLDTATLTNLGRLQMPPWMAERVAGFYGAPPVFPPMGVGLMAGSTSLGLHIGLRASNATLEPQDAQALLQRFLERLQAFGA